jgi:hypothetical protein
MARLTGRRYSDNATTVFPAVGSYDSVVNTSGADWEGAEMARKRGTVSASAPSRPLSSRAPETIDGDTGQTLGDLTERAAADAARHLSIKETVVQGDPGLNREMERHLFGLNLPGRDQA